MLRLVARRFRCAVTARLGLKMIKSGVRRVDHRIARITHPKAEIYVISVDRELNSVETSKSLEQLATYSDASACDRTRLVHEGVPAEIASLTSFLADAFVRQEVVSGFPRDKACMLQSAVLIKEPTSNSTYPRLKGARNKLVKPVLAQNYRIIV
ncbi:hypothetical protein QE389_001977 [Brevundimonas sp. SORGH_AS 993]|nr:hypothetical protein [Brevundimonas sp. SORGH_AS_0993]MDQ1154778.1 hypothetical protein [Brevundimonas sp. SORGH_AS_0993]